MENYKIIFTDIALNNLKKYPEKDQKLILKNIELLSQNPFTKNNVKKLVEFSVSYRLRVGAYRVLFEKEDTLKIIDVINILRRKNAYQRN